MSEQVPPCPRLDVRPYRGQWVALHPQTHGVVGHGQSLGDAEHDAAAHGVTEPLLFPVPESDGFFVGMG